jgi:hypothetical protein
MHTYSPTRVCISTMYKVLYELVVTNMHTSNSYACCMHTNYADYA